MPVSNLVAITALILTLYNEIPKFIQRKDEEIDIYYIIFSCIISILWTYYHVTNSSYIGQIVAGFFLFTNSVLLVRCLQRRTGFLKARTSPAK